MVTQRVRALAALGFSVAHEQLYRELIPYSGEPLSEAARRLRRPEATLESQIRPFMDAGMMTVEGDLLLVHDPAHAVAHLLAGQTDYLRAAAGHIDRLREAVTMLRTGDGVEPVEREQGEHGGAAFRGEVLSGQPVDVPAILQSWIADSTGDLCWMRPDQWRLSSGSVMNAAVRDVLLQGRRSRAIYPARVLEEAPEVVFERASAGEEVRIVTDVPARMAIVGDAGALLPEWWSEPAETGRIVVREPGMLTTLTAFFEELWNRAIVVPGAWSTSEDDHAVRRRLLLEALSSGAKDEQIARSLGVSLRTVRRRVAELFEELGVETRFQAGVEAVRRGWI